MTVKADHCTTAYASSTIYHLTLAMPNWATTNYISTMLLHSMVNFCMSELKT